MQFSRGGIGRLVGRVGGRAGTTALALVVLVASAAVGLRGTIVDTAGTDPFLAVKAVTPACAGDDPTVTEVRDRLLAGPLGEGVTAYPGSPVIETVESQAAMLLAEVACVRQSPARDRTTMDALGERLLTWPTRHGAGAPGWGVATAWDAFADGTTNAAGTVYAIPTALAAKALLDWAEVSVVATAARAYAVVDTALAPWSEPGVRTADGLLAYSLDAHDADRGLFGASVLLAGQLQRFSTLRTSSRSAAYAATADAVITSALRHRRTDRFGNWYWSTSPGADDANDIASAGYLIDGAVTYDRYRGARRSTLSLGAIERHLLAFNTGGTSPEPLLRAPSWQASAARDRLTLADLGWTMYVVTLDRDQLGDLAEPLCSQAPRYRDADGRYVALPADGGASGPSTEIYDDVAFHYLGLVTMGADVCRDGAGAFAGVPFVGFVTGATTLALQVDVSTLRSRLVGDGRVLSVPGAAVPLGVYDAGDTTVAIVRTMPTGALAFVRWRADRGAVSVPVPDQGDAALALRASLRTDDSLLLVVYDARTNGLRLQRYRWSTLAFDREWSLPPLDTATATTDADGRVLLTARPGAGIEIVGGSLHASLTGDALTTGRLDGCAEALEVAVDGSGPVALCRTLPPGYALVRPGGAPTPVASTGAPYALRVDTTGGAAPQWSDAAADPAAWLEFELRHRDNHGTAELGASNRDGRVARVQLPYLDALLDAQAAGGRLGTLSDGVARRLVVEIALLERNVRADGYGDRSRSTDGSRQLHADEVGRLVLTLSRARTEVQGLPPLFALERLAATVSDLVGYAEAIERDLPGVGAGRAGLAWPKGRPVPLDGANTPFAVQNEWAQAVVLTQSPGVPVSDAARDALAFFFDRVAVPSGGSLPADGRWPATFGRAASGWATADGVSDNRPTWPGDPGPASLDARTVDARAMVAWSTALRDDDGARLRTSVGALVTNGSVRPRLAGALAAFGEQPAIDPSVRARFGRAGTSADLGDAVWANTLAVA